MTYRQTPSADVPDLCALAIGGFALLAVLASGCGGGIPLNQEAVFQAQPSITPATFERSNSQLEETFFGGHPEIHGWYFDRDDSTCTTLFFGGQRFHMVLARRRVESFLDRVPVDVLMYDYRGYGRSRGEPTVEGLKQDALEAYDHLVESFDADCVVAHGHSLGTFLATWVATRRDVDGLVLEAPVVSVQRFTRELVPWYLRFFLNFDIDPAFEGEDNAERIADVEAPTLLIAGEKDDVAPVPHAETLDERAQGQPTILATFEKGNHNNLDRQPAFDDRYRELLCAMDRCPEDGRGDDS
jgi:pimeloyl-ACP methyl ester carboxylesterase